ncbi:MAG: transketolase C-terminal domain-containing protein [Sphaerochaetaceae bacterium]|nr:transketolase C-terminal domain-containing protein [Sphaerochaetaceae bacterium]
MRASLRQAYGEALVELGEKNRNVVAMDADLGKSTMSCLFQNAFPERYFQMGIAEQNMLSTAAGLALGGKIPFVSTFAVFATGRPYDQIRSSIAIAGLHVVICGSSAGLSDYGDGKTHQSIDDIALMRVLPHMQVYCPCDAVSVKGLMPLLAEGSGPAYLRVSRADLPVVYQGGEDFREGLFRLRDGKDAVVFACGTMVHESLKAAELLEKQGISVRVVDLYRIKPLNYEALLREAEGMQAIVTAEEHNIHAGMGSAVAEALGKVGMVGVQDCYGTSASNYEELLVRYHLTDKDIAAKVVEMLGTAYTRFHG